VAAGGGPALTPAQRQVADGLFAPGEPRPTFDEDLAAGLAARLDAELGPATAGLEAPLVVTKAALARVHACEAHYQVDSFRWNPAVAAGTVTHRAVDLAMGWGGAPSALDLVEGAYERLTEGEGDLADYLRELSAPEEADVRTRANAAVVAFLECWPMPLPRRWQPRTEARLGAVVAGAGVVLKGKVDLALGVARGSTARVLVVDLKTGEGARGHLDDLRFYALVQALRTGVPPFRVATYYLASGRFQHEDVTLDSLEAAVLRTVEGARRMLELEAGRPARRRAGPQCRWCLLRPECPEAAEAEAAEAGAGGRGPRATAEDDWPDAPG